MNRYHIIREVGSGTNGSVFKAESKNTGEIVALKKVDITDKKGALLEYLLSEGTMMKHLNRGRRHPNVARYIDSFQYREGKKKIYVIISDFIDGVDLDTLIEEKKKFPIGQVWEWMRQMASGLAFMHKNDVAHRDFKPNNVMVDKDMNLHIVDYGLSCFRPCYANSTAGIIKPPEKQDGYLEQYPPIEITSMGLAREQDVWALGVSCYYLANKGTYPSGDKFDLKALTELKKSNYVPSKREKTDEFLVSVTNLAIMGMLVADVNLRPSMDSIEKFFTEEISGINVNGSVYTRQILMNMIFDRGMILNKNTLYSLQTLYDMAMGDTKIRTAFELDKILRAS